MQLPSHRRSSGLASAEGADMPARNTIETMSEDELQILLAEIRSKIAAVSAEIDRRAPAA